MNQEFQLSRKIIAILCILSFSLIFIVYSNHFHNAFHFDDSHVIESNIHIQQLKNIPRFFTDATLISSLPSNQQYRPMVATTLAIDYWLGNDLKPFWFHVSMFSWFLIQCGFIYFFFLSIANSVTKNPWNALFAIYAMTFYGIHTANAETINYICARSDSMSTCWLIIALVIFIKLPQYRKRGFHLVPFIIACLFKQTAIVYPALLLLYVLLFEQQQSLFTLFRWPHAISVWKRLIQSTGFTWLVGCALYIFVRQMDPPSYFPGGSSVYAYLITQPFVILHYFFTFFLPVQLSADTDWTTLSSIIDDRFFVGVLFIIGLVWIAFKTSRQSRTRPITFGILWFLIALLPTSSIIPLAEVMNDHRMFFPFVGLTLAVSFSIYQFLIDHATSFREPIKKYILLIGIALILGVFAFGTYQRNLVWKTEESLWYDTTLKSPKNGRGLMNYGLTQMQKGDLLRAEHYFMEALNYTPMYGSLHLNLGIVNAALGKEDLANQYYENAIRYEGNTPQVLNFYAMYYLKKDTHKAERALLKSLSLSHGLIETYHLLMTLYWEQEKWEKLGKVVQDALQLSPKDAPTLQYQYFFDHRLNKIHAQLEMIHQLPTADNYMTLSLLYFEKKDYPHVIEASRQVIKLEPQQASAYNNICAAYNEMGQFREAEASCKKALEINPEFQLAKNNLYVSQQGWKHHG